MTCIDYPRFTDDPVRTFQVAKLASIVATLAVSGVVSMAFVPNILTESARMSITFRYTLLVNIALRVIGLGAQFAILTVLLKWILAGACGVLLSDNVPPVPPVPCTGVCFRFVDDTFSFRLQD